MEDTGFAKAMGETLIFKLTVVIDFTRRYFNHRIEVIGIQRYSPKNPNYYLKAEIKFSTLNLVFVAQRDASEYGCRSLGSDAYIARFWKMTWLISHMKKNRSSNGKKIRHSGIDPKTNSISPRIH